MSGRLTLVSNPAEEQVVTVIKELRGKQGLAYQEIADRLHRIGTVMRNGKPWSRFQVRKIVDRPESGA